MSIRTYPPTTTSRRFATGVIRDEITDERQEKKLLRILAKKSGRSHGQITVRHQGGRVKRYYRLIDFKRQKIGVLGRVAAIEYDPNRGTSIALIHYSDGEKRYILAPLGLKFGDEIVSADNAPINLGNCLPLANIPLGAFVHNIEMNPGGGGQLVRGAGLFATLLSKDEKYAILRLPSSETRKILLNCRATIGQLSNPEKSSIKWGKAGRKTYLGIRPVVRGVAMPAGTHPHGGGEGRTGPGRPSKTIYGKNARRKTRKKNKRSEVLIIQRSPR